MAASVFGIDTDPIVILRDRQVDGGAPKRHNQRHPNGQWRPAKAAASIIKPKPRLRNPSPIAFYNWIGSVADWERIMAHPNWYTITQHSQKSDIRDWVLSVYDRSGNRTGRKKSYELKRRFFHSQAQATKFAMALINIHLSKQGQA